MTTLEKAGAWIAVVAFVFTAGVAWAGLNNRIDKVDDKIGAIQKTLGSTNCMAILQRQITAIEKDRPLARKQLDALSDAYGCAPRQSASASIGLDAAEDVRFNTTSLGTSSSNLSARLDEIDSQLNGAR